MATVITIHPGKHLAKELKEPGMSAAELALKLDTYLFPLIPNGIAGDEPEGVHKQDGHEHHSPDSGFSCPKSAAPRGRGTTPV